MPDRMKGRPVPEPARRAKPKAVTGLIVNLVVPGAGSLIIGRAAVGIVQLVIFLAAVFMNLTGSMAVIGFPLWIAVWMWALLTSIAASRPSD